MSAIQPFTQLFHKVLFMSFQAAVLAGLVALTICLFRRRLSPQWRYVLWLLVLIRLCIPWAPETAFSIYNLTILRQPAADTTLSEFQNDSTRTVVPIAQTQTSTQLEASHLPIQPAVNATGITGADALVPHGTTPVSVGRRLVTILNLGLPGIWLLGTFVLGMRLLLSHMVLSRRLRRLRPVTDTDLLDLLEDCKAEMAMHTPVTLLGSDLVGTPALLGFVRPCFVVNPDVLRHFSRAELRHIILHELAHLKRLDIPVTWLMELLRIVHWFNPMLWIAFSMMRAEREAACDALVLARVRRDESQCYGETLLKLMSQVAQPVLAAGFMGVLERHEAVKSRIRLISTFHSRRGHPVFALVLTLLLAMVGLTDARLTSVDSGPSYAAQGYANLLRLSGRTEIDPVLRKFAVAKWQKAQELALNKGVTIESQVREFFSYAVKGDWILATAFFEDIKLRRNDPGYVSTLHPVDNAIWHAARETDMAFEQFISWDPNVLRRYARDVLKGTDEHTVLFMGTDPGRAVISVFNEVRPESNVIIVAQDSLDDSSYLDYLHLQYQDRLRLPAAEQTGAQDMARQLFEEHKSTHDFLVEEGKIMPWMQPHLAPHGLLMKLSPEPIEGRFSDSIVSADRNFWNSRTNELVEKPTCEINSQQAISYSRMRAAIAGLYERRSMPEEAEYAYQQARLICPQNVAVALMLADFYLRNNKDRECLAVLLDVQQHEPSSPELAETIQLVSERITRRLARGPEDQNKDSSQ